jgi:signal peptidase I
MYTVSLTSFTTLNFRHLLNCVYFQHGNNGACQSQRIGVRAFHNSSILRKRKVKSKSYGTERIKSRKKAPEVFRPSVSQEFANFAKLSGKRRSLFSREALLAGSKRAPFLLLPAAVLGLYLIQNDGNDNGNDDERQYLPAFPFAIDSMSGPSMLPTIHPAGEFYFRNNLFHRLPKFCRRDWNVGDVVVILDYKGDYACKRIIGMGGDEVLRYGEFAATRYSNLGDYGVTSVENEERFQSSPIPSWTSRSDVTIQSEGNELEQRVIIPPGHVWVEGDNPIFSIDSRHYGPVPISNINGRVVCRIWPRQRNGDSCFIDPMRPEPLTRDIVMSGNYNVDTAKIKK